jgi:hypothetical protein
MGSEYQDILGMDNTDPDGSIPFTQYLRPQGHTQRIAVRRPFAITQKAKHILSLGYVFEIEVLRTGQVSVSIADNKKGEDVEIEVCNNGPEVLIAVDTMIRRFNEEKYVNEHFEDNTLDEPTARNIKLHTAWIEAIVRRVTADVMQAGYIRLDEVTAVEAEKRARENFEMALGFKPGSLKIDGGH